jgi:hypothetical protein
MFNLLYPGPESLSITRVTVSDATQQLLVSGIPEVYFEVVNGSNPEFDNYRHESVINTVAPYLRKRDRRTGSLSEAEVAVFLKRIIEITGNYNGATLRDMLRGQVSPTSDCFALNATGLHRIP